MAARSPARFLAPLALVAVIGVLYLIVKPQSSGESGSATPTTTAQPAKKQSAKKTRKKKTPKTYTVQSGDTPSGIAEKAGISLAQLEALNPSLDPQALAPGEKLKLR
jgi:LysM repeat protein